MSEDILSKLSDLVIELENELMNIDATSEEYVSVLDRISELKEFSEDLESQDLNNIADSIKEMSSSLQEEMKNTKQKVEKLKDNVDSAKKIVGIFDKIIDLTKLIV